MPTTVIEPPTPIHEDTPRDVDKVTFEPLHPENPLLHPDNPLLHSHTRTRTDSASSYNSSSLSKRSSQLSNLEMPSHFDDDGSDPAAVSSALPAETTDGDKGRKVARNGHAYVEDTDDCKINYDYYGAHTEEVDVGAEMEKWYSLADRYGFIGGDEFAKSAGPASVAEKKEAERSKKWAKMAKQCPDNQMYKFPPTSKFVRRVYKGIPDAWRGQAWYFMISDNLKSASKDPDLLIKYKELLQVSSTHERQIDLDVPRTMYSHIMFKTRYGYGQRILFNVLRAFSIDDPEVGYCQGMSNVVAMLLMYFEEEKCFTALVHLFHRYNLHNLFIPGFPALLESFYIQERLVERFAPKVFKRFDKLQITPSAYGTRWYITLFTGGVVPYRTLLRIWDVFFLVGFDVLFFVSLELLRSNQAVLAIADFEKAMDMLSSKMPVPDDDAFMRRVKRLAEKNKEEMIVDELRYQYQKTLRVR